LSERLNLRYGFEQSLKEVVVQPDDEIEQSHDEIELEPRPHRSIWTRVVQFTAVGLIVVLGVETIGVGRTDSAMTFIGCPLCWR
jgi:hypothetical protein